MVTVFLVENKPVLAGVEAENYKPDYARYPEENTTEKMVESPKNDSASHSGERPKEKSPKKGPVSVTAVSPCPPLSQSRLRDMSLASNSQVSLSQSGA